MGLEPTAFQLGTGCAIQLRHVDFYVWLDSNQLHNYAAEGCLTAPAFQQRAHTLNRSHKNDIFRVETGDLFFLIFAVDDLDAFFLEC